MPEATETIREAQTASGDTTSGTLAAPLSFRGLVLWAALAVTLVLSAEIALRLDDLLRQDIPLSAVPNLRKDLMIFDSLGQRGRPNGRFQRWKLNSAGFRSPESVLTRRPGCLQVMIIGTSETFGAAGESEGQEYPVQLGDSLAKGGCYQVLNAAIVGQTLPEQISFWNTWGQRFHPDIVVVMGSTNTYLLNDSPKFRSPGDYREPPGQPWWTPRLIGKAYDLVAFPAFINRMRVQRRLDASAAGHTPDWFFDTVPPDRLNDFRRDLDSLVTAIRSTGAKPVLVTYPNRFGTRLRPEDKDILDAWRQFTPRARPEVMLAFSSEGARVVRDLGRCREVPVADAFTALDGRWQLFFDFVHYTNEGAGAIAGVIAPAIATAAADTSDPTRLRPCP